ncbi:NAD(P)-dependent dehydrogenase (short-subunit alcohol dehydrogenase family) [Actinoplanes lutulentus]|uniref:NAD(P)-dependent dehydrogenase (Short-subunit alcohol dehydrogenase family) n=1 Tax=Actinoplanes lutulentus TaxID=1287878 RepID=A0A327Z1Y6_9ACTN|nr:SDR family oxidoreductase [Actinoplanes lutulentus]MBB2943345.1 NAD(P)-dependent dehydrogenase (short-subunit alcohol dehydrogenase family) [Actinoplanes lutulentus]RAK28404.1 NAD(P)-dependent dehydrogenase (short-subunit alcohol dehydrogenase family) [Actinoplanes lutulentus]
MTQTAIITGGAGGMGLATAKILGSDHRVVIADLDQQRLDTAVAELAAGGIEAASAVCDITDRASVERLLDEAERGGHHVRAVVHAAGISPQMGSAERVARINGTGTVNVTRAFLARAAEGDVLVNVASTAGHGLPKILIPFGSFRLAETDPAAFERAIVRRARVAGRKLHSGIAYGISKAFVLWYTRSQAVAFGKRGARIVSVSPGSFDTAMGRLEENHGAAEFLKVSAIKRFGKPEEIAAVLAFCAGSAPGYLTGVDILVDGGARAGAEFRKRPGVTP